MQLFNLLHPRLFKPLSGKRQVLYADILILLWKGRRRSHDYGREKAAMTALLEEYLLGLAPDLT